MAPLYQERPTSSTHGFCKPEADAGENGQSDRKIKPEAHDGKLVDSGCGGADELLEDPIHVRSRFVPLRIEVPVVQGEEKARVIAIVPSASKHEAGGKARLHAAGAATSRTAGMVNGQAKQAAGEIR